MKILTSLKLLSPAILLAFGGSASAQSVSWGSSYSPMPIGCTSEGEPAGDSLTWCLGYFTAGFIPSAENSDEWMANFVTVDTATEGDAVAGHKSNAALAADGHTPSNAVGKQMYVFAYNDPAKIGTPEGEALIYFQEGLYFPSNANFVTFDIARNKKDSADDSLTVIWGRVDRDMQAPGGLTTGGGVFYAPLEESSPSQWEAQSASWPSSPTLPFDELASTLEGAQNGADDDYDSDGRSNFLEHAIGTSMGSVDAGYAVIDIRKNAVDFTLPSNRPSDVQYILEYSETLASTDWKQLSSRRGNNGWQGASPMATLKAPNTREISSFKTPTGKKGFFRVRFESAKP